MFAHIYSRTCQDQVVRSFGWCPKLANPDDWIVFHLKNTSVAQGRRVVLFVLVDNLAAAIRSADPGVRLMVSPLQPRLPVNHVGVACLDHLVVCFFQLCRSTISWHRFHTTFQFAKLMSPTLVLSTTWVAPVMALASKCTSSWARLFFVWQPQHSGAEGEPVSACIFRLCANEQSTSTGAFLASLQAHFRPPSLNGSLAKTTVEHDLHLKLMAIACDSMTSV